MTSSKILRKTFLFAACVLGLVGCQSLDVQPLPANANPSDEISKLQTDEAAAHEQQVNILSPSWYGKAQAALEDAKKSRADGDTPEDTLEYVKTGRADLKKAEEVAAVSRSALGDVVQARQDALNGGANEHAGKKLDDVDADLRAATRKVEKDDTSEAVNNRAKFVSRYRAVELTAIREGKLASARDNIAKAKDEDAKDLVPITFARANASYKTADEFIGQHTHDSAGIQKLADIANSDADRLLKFTRDAKSLGGRSPETVLLQKETAGKQLAEEKVKLGQSEADAANKQKTINREQRANATLQGTNEDLASEKEFNERFNKAQAQFTSEEAEVFKQGGTLVVRLKGLEFPSGTATIRPEKMALLSKVKQVIQSFGPSHVVVAGHTDAVGSSSKNQKLSEARADAVVQYLVANAAVTPANSEAVGYGDQKPLATNKSDTGRAQNRRVDITIAPEESQLSR